MDKFMIRVHDLETDTVIDREMTNAEQTKYEAEILANAENKAKVEAKAQAKAKLLQRLGITADEAKLLLS